jgi:hypothetical protein
MSFKKEKVYEGNAFRSAVERNLVLCNNQICYIMLCYVIYMYNYIYMYINKTNSMV